VRHLEVWMAPRFEEGGCRLLRGDFLAGGVHSPNIARHEGPKSEVGVYK
jgi:hypothetical protein